jgi:hypothetical protein
MSQLIEKKAGDARRALGRDSECDAEHEANPSAAPPESHERVRGIVSSWLDNDLRIFAPGETVVGAASSEQCGFLCVVEINGEVILLCCDGTFASDRPAEVELACRHASGQNSALDLRAVASALETIRQWVSRRQSGVLAGIGATGFLGSRRKILARIDFLAARVPPHCRPRRAQLFQNARLAASAVHGIAVEKELLSLATNAREMEEDAWLSRVAKVGTQSLKRTAGRDYKVRALLLLAPPTPPPSS